MRRIALLIGGALTTTVCTAGALGSIEPKTLKPLISDAFILENHERLHRTWTFWQSLFPIYARLRSLQLWFDANDTPQAERDAAYEELFDLYAESIVEVPMRLRGLFIKLGQIGSTRADLLPPQWVKSLTKLQDSIAPEGEDFIREMISNNFGGKRIEDLFMDFDMKPIAAASIAQVHRAKLRDGTSVIIKIQYPYVKRYFELDFMQARLFCSLAQPAHLPMLNELEKQFVREFDFQAEAETLRAISSSFESDKWIRSRFATPKLIDSMCTDQVLVMTELKGTKITDYFKRSAEEIAKQKNWVRSCLRGAGFVSCLTMSHFSWGCFRLSIKFASITRLRSSSVDDMPR